MSLHIYEHSEVSEKLNFLWAFSKFSQQTFYAHCTLSHRIHALIKRVYFGSF